MNNVVLYNVPFNEGQPDVIHFTKLEHQVEYFATLRQQTGYELTRYTMKPSGRIILKGYTNNAQQYNYMSYYNEDGANRGRTYYAYIRSVERGGDNTIAIEYALDYWQTYMFDFKLMPSYVERRHVQRWAPDGKATFNGCETEEDIEIGSEYVNGIMYGFDYIQYGDPEIYFVWIVMTEKMAGSETLVTTTQNGFGGYNKQYIYGTILGVASNGALQRFNLRYTDKDGNEKTAPLANMQNSDLTALLQGDKVYAVYVTNLFPLGIGFSRTVANEYTVNIGAGLHSVVGVGEAYGNVFTIETSYYSQEQSRQSWQYPLDEELKMSCYPFTYDTVSINRSTQYPFKVQYYNGVATRSGLTITITYNLSVGEKLKQSVLIGNYLGGYQNNLIVDNTVTELPLYSSRYVNFMYSSKASMQAGLTNTQNSAVASIASGFVKAVPAAATAGSNPMGAANAVAGFIGDSINTAQGVANAERSYNAKITDLQNTPDTLRKGGNDAIFEMINLTLGVRRFRSTLPPKQEQRLRAYFNRYGYAVKKTEQTIPLQLRERWDYIETRDAWVTGNLNATARANIAAMFNRGVRLWHYRSSNFDFGNFNLSNSEAYI